MDDHLIEMVNLIVKMAEMNADEWIELAEMLCGIDVAPAKHKSLTRLYNQMDSTERLTALSAMLLLSKGKLSDPFVDLGIKRGSLPMITAYFAIN